MSGPADASDTSYECPTCRQNFQAKNLFMSVAFELPKEKPKPIVEDYQSRLAKIKQDGQAEDDELGELPDLKKAKKEPALVENDSKPNVQEDSKMSLISKFAENAADDKDDEEVPLSAKCKRLLELLERSFDMEPDQKTIVYSQWTKSECVFNRFLHRLTGLDSVGYRRRHALQKEHQILSL